jgi:hypothetical protein
VRGPDKRPGGQGRGDLGVGYGRVNGGTDVLAERERRVGQVRRGEGLAGQLVDQGVAGLGELPDPGAGTELGSQAVQPDGRLGMGAASRFATQAARVGLRSAAICFATAGWSLSRAWAASSARRWVNSSGSAS